MLDLSRCNEWQHRDPDTGLVMPWYTKSFLDILITWDVSDKIVFEWGCGASTLWWAHYAGFIYSVDEDRDYIEAVIQNMIVNRKVNYDLNEINAYGKNYKKEYVGALDGVCGTPDIIIVDGAGFRDECIEKAIDFIPANHPVDLIVDNWMQPSVWVATPEIQKLITRYEHRIYSQHGHPDWKTLHAIIKK